MTSDYQEIFASEYRKLNEKQKEAVDALQGAVLVIAGPGTGKTQILAMRIANILQQTDSNASDILCLTFTDTGVAAMRERLLRIIGPDAYYVHLHTFHSFCNEVIQSFPEKFAFARDLVQLDDIRRIRILRKILDELDSQEIKFQLVPFFNKYQYQKAIEDAIKTLKREGISALKLQEIAKSNLQELEANPDINSKTGKPKSKWAAELKSAQKIIELATIYQKYTDILQEEGLYDYEDMIMFVINKFIEDEELLAIYQEKYLYILVDEYQDTNGAQNQIIKLLGSNPLIEHNNPNIFAVGDDDQAIYRFQGANVENLLFFQQQFGNVNIITITENYRSSQLILDNSNSVISNNKNRLVNYVEGLDKTLTSGLDVKSEKVKVYEFDNQDNENYFLVKKVKELNAQGVKYSDIAVLYRKHSDAEDIVETFLKSEIPIKLVAGSNVLDEKVIRKFLNLLKVINYKDRRRDLLMFEVLAYDFLQFDRLDLFKLTRLASDKRLPLVDVIIDDELLASSGIKNKKALTLFLERLTNWRADAANYSLIEFIEMVGMESGYVDYIFSKNFSVEDINSVKSFFNFVRSANNVNRQLTLDEFLNEIDILEENNVTISEQELDVRKDAVNLMTAHKSKGLEFEHVFIVKAYDGNWGGRKARSLIKLPAEVFDLVENKKINDDIDFDQEDERRLFFVALTRAKKHLYVSYAKEYVNGGTNSKTVAPSLFVSELNSQLIERPDVTEYQNFDIEFARRSLSPFVELNYAEEEREYLTCLVNEFILSPSTLNSYIKCPLEFKFNCLLKIPTPKDETQILGESVHYALEVYLRALCQKREVDSEYMLNAFRYRLRAEPMGAETYNRIKLEGEKILLEYCKNYSGNFVIPAEIEYSFQHREIVLVDGNELTVRLGGKFDKVELLDPATNEVKVVDYKTMAPKSANDIRGKTKNADASIFRQLVFYKLLGDLDPMFKPAGRMASKYKIVQGEVDFLKPNQSGKYKKETFEITHQDVEELKVTIRDVMQRIKNLEFGGSEEYPLCGECEYCEMMTH